LLRITVLELEQRLSMLEVTRVWCRPVLLQLHLPGREGSKTERTVPHNTNKRMLSFLHSLHCLAGMEELLSQIAALTRFSMLRHRTFQRSLQRALVIISCFLRLAAPSAVLHP